MVGVPDYQARLTCQVPDALDRLLADLEACECLRECLREWVKCNSAHFIMVHFQTTDAIRGLRYDIKLLNVGGQGLQQTSSAF